MRVLSIIVLGILSLLSLAEALPDHQAIRKDSRLDITPRSPIVGGGSRTSFSAKRQTDCVAQCSSDSDLLAASTAGNCSSTDMPCICRVVPLLSDDCAICILNGISLPYSDYYTQCLAGSRSNPITTSTCFSDCTYSWADMMNFDAAMQCGTGTQCVCDNIFGVSSNCKACWLSSESCKYCSAPTIGMSDAEWESICALTATTTTTAPGSDSTAPPDEGSVTTVTVDGAVTTVVVGGGSGGGGGGGGGSGGSSGGSGGGSGGSGGSGSTTTTRAGSSPASTGTSKSGALPRLVQDVVNLVVVCLTATIVAMIA